MLVEDPTGQTQAYNLPANNGPWSFALPGRTSGLHRVWVEAEDEAGNIKQVGAYSFIRQIPLTGLQLTILDGDEAHLVNEVIILQANTQPSTATTPITYFWQASEQISRTVVGDNGNIQIYTWTTTGTKRLTVTAHSPLNSLTATTTITITELFIPTDELQLYLPLVMK
jgi:hypothetical protein